MADWVATTELTGHARARLRRYARLFVALGEAFPTLDGITPEKLSSLLGTDGLRRQRVPYAWLVAQQHILCVPEKLSQYQAETLTQDRLMARVTVPWKAELLQRYATYLHRVKATWRKRGWYAEHERFTERTVTLLLRAAYRFLGSLDDDVLSTQGIDSFALAQFAVKLPGHRNSLHSFVGYLNRKEKLFQKLHLESGGTRGFPYPDLMSPERAHALMQGWLHGGERPVRNALMCLLMLVYARTTTQTCALTRGMFEVTAEGQVTAKFGALPVELDPAIAALLLEHFEERKATLQRPLVAEDYVFAGLLPGRPFSPAGVQYILKKQNVTANELYTTAIAAFFRAGLRGPKVLVRTLGISDQTAVKYWEAFCPRINDEMNYLTDSSLNGFR